MKSIHWSLVIASLAFAVGLSLAIPVSPARAHSLVCPNGQPLRWVGTTHTYYTPDVAGYTQEVHDAASNMSVSTDFDWVNDWRPWAAETSWAMDYYGDLGWAGSYFLSIDCSGSNSQILAASFRLNRSHLDGDSASRRQCTAIHEFGHGVGLSEIDLGISSIMENPHEQRCHTWLIETVQPHDVSDINALY